MESYTTKGWGAFDSHSTHLVSVIFVLSGDYINNAEEESSCDKQEEKNKIFEEYVYGRDVTNYNVGKKQFDATNLFSQALVQDTTLFGTNGFECPGGNGTKSEYANVSTRIVSIFILLLQCTHDSLDLIQLYPRPIYNYTCTKSRWAWF